MKPATSTIHQLFSSHRRYCVPIYQRHYVWTEQEQWANLWDDLRSKATARLGGKPSRYPHYMGALVLEKREVTFAAEVAIVDVIDGQQRLTTLQVLLAALRDVARLHGATTIAKLAERSMLNEHPEEMRDPEVERYKLWPTHHDRETYLAILNAGSRAEVQKLFTPFFRSGTERLGVWHRDKQPRLLQAYIYFHDTLDAFAIDATEPHLAGLEKRLDAALMALRQDFRVVEIQLESDDDAQVIFETLNDRGTPLLAADLIRNYIFLRATRENAIPEKLYENKWKPLEDSFWSETDTRGRLTRPRLEFFLLQYLAARTGAEVNLIRLFAEYKAFAEGEQGPPTVEAEIVDILRFAPHYRTLVSGEGTNALARLGRRLQPWDVGTAQAPVLAIAVRDMDDEERDRAFTDIVSYIVRRAVCDKTTKNLNNVFLGLARAVVGCENVGETVRGFLLSQRGESGIWPNDADFRQYWIDQPLYSTLHPVSRVRAILTELELRSRTSKVDPAPLPPELWVEHLMPQMWSTHWPLRDGTIVSENEVVEVRARGRTAEVENGKHGEIARRERILNTIGNLTLHTASLGTSIKNAGFSHKQQEFRAYGLFHLTKGFTGPDVARWDEDSIRARSETLLKTALEVWPHPGPSALT